MTGCSAGVMVRIYLQEDRYRDWMHCWCNGKNFTCRRTGIVTGCSAGVMVRIYL